jgi:hypothetical protein
MNKLVLIGFAAGMAAFCGQAQAKIFTLSFTGIDDPAVHGAGALTTSDTGSPYAVTGASGTITAPDVSAAVLTITGLSGYASADQILNFPAGLAFDFSGLSFSTDTGGDFNIFYYSDAGVYGLISSVLNAGGYIPGPYSPIAVQITPVPELSTWTMLGLGFAGLGLAALRSRKTAISAIG